MSDDRSICSVGKPQHHPFQGALLVQVSSYFPPSSLFQLSIIKIDLSISSIHQMMPLYIPRMVSLHICCFLFGLALFGGISILVLALVTLFGMGGIESAVSVGLVCFYVSMLILLPPWSAGPTSSGYHGPKRAINLKDLTVDTYVVVDENDQPPCDQDYHCCSICLGDLCAGESATRGRACGHIFHEECLTMWVNKSATCPYCRQELDIDSTSKSDIHKTGMWGILDGVFASIYS
jgi:hypothetical protein